MSRGFDIYIFIITGFFAGFTLANIIAFNRLRSGANSSISSGEATVLMWLNILLFIAALIAFIWAIVQLVSSFNDKPLAGSIILPTGIDSGLAAVGTGQGLNRQIIINPSSPRTTITV